MGKKRIIQPTQAELIKEREKVEAKVTKEITGTSKALKEGKIFISSTYNNTIISLSDTKGNILGWVTAGSVGFKGTKKSTPFAASKVAEAISLVANKFGIEKVGVCVKGIGSGRESAIRSLLARGLEVTSIIDKTPVPHNGCRPPKARRV